MNDEWLEQSEKILEKNEYVNGIIHTIIHDEFKGSEFLFKLWLSISEVNCSRYEIMAAMSKVESPIEMNLLAALLYESQNHVDSLRISLSSHVSTEPAEKIKSLADFGRAAMCGSTHITIAPQFTMDKYRMDFVIHRCEHCPSKESYAHKFVAIECDGHDFHERTVEQAGRDKKRDRIIQKYMPVLRFTGSEIHKDPISCAEQCFEFLSDSRLGALEPVKELKENMHQEINLNDRWADLLEKIRDCNPVLFVKLEHTHLIGVAAKRISIGVSPKMNFLAHSLRERDVHSKLLTYISVFWGPGYSVDVQIVEAS